MKADKAKKRSNILFKISFKNERFAIIGMARCRKKNNLIAKTHAKEKRNGF